MSYSLNSFHPFSISRYLLLLVYLSGTSSCRSGSKANDQKVDIQSLIQLPKPGPVSEAEQERIKNASQIWYDIVLKLRGFNGGIIVAKDGNIIFEKYSGTTHIPGSDLINENSALHIASVSKTFTAMAVLKLMEDEKLNLDDEFSKYFPAFNYPGTTIRSLLSHRSGLPNYNYFMESLGWDQSHYVTNDDVLNFLITRKSELPDQVAPNTHFSYCNTNFALLALLIEKISGQPYADFLSQHFFIPLQMNNTYVFDIKDSATAIPSYNWRGKLETLNFLDQVYGDKNIYSTVRDLLIWDRALNSDLIFKSQTLDLAYAPYSNEKPGTRNYGLGWRMNIFPDGNPKGSVNKIIYHNGWWHGSNATFIRLLKEKATIIVIGNKFTRAVYHAKVLTSLFGNYYTPVDEGELENVKDANLTIEPELKSDSLPVNHSNSEKKAGKEN